MLKVSVTKFHPTKKIKTNWIKQVVKETLKHEDISDGEVSVVLGDDELLKRLNKEYRGVDSSTDVLAFPWGQSLNYKLNTQFIIQALTPMLGEIIISVDAVYRQAKEYKHSFEEELNLLLVHGVLHLLGYDHTHKYLPQEPMAIRTEEILEVINSKFKLQIGG